LQELLVFQEDLHHGLGVIHEVFGIEPELLEFGVLADQILDRVLKDLDDVGQGGLVGWGFDVEDDFVFDSEIPGDRQGIGGGASVVVVVDGGHERGAVVENLKRVRWW
jgi:hypothetical protein